MNHKLRAMSYDTSYKLRVTSYKLLAMSFEIQVTSYELKSATCQILPALADDSMVQDLDCSMNVQCKIVPYIDRFQLSRLICAG